MTKNLLETYRQLQEIYAVPGTPAGNAYNKALNSNQGKSALPLQAGQKKVPMDSGVRRPIAGTNNPGNAAPKSNVTNVDKSSWGKVATNNQLTAQASALKNANPNKAGAGGGNYAAAVAKKAPALDPNRNANLDRPTTNSNMALAQNPGSAGTGSAFGKQSGSGTTIPKPGAAQAATTTQNNQPVTANAKIGASAKPNFKQAYAAARKAGQTNFEWNGKKFNTAMKGETSKKRTQVLNKNAKRTAGASARKGSLMETVKELVSQKLDEARKDAKPTPAYVSNKTSRGRTVHASASSNFKAGAKVRNRYKGAFSEEEQQITGTDDAKKKKKTAETIDISPEKSDMIQAR